MITTEKIVHDFTINLLNALKDFKSGCFEAEALPKCVAVIDCWTTDGAKKLAEAINDIAHSPYTEEFLLNLSFPDHAIKRLTAVIVSYVNQATISSSGGGGKRVCVRFRDYDKDNIGVEEFIEIVGNWVCKDMKETFGTFHTKKKNLRLYTTYLLAKRMKSLATLHRTVLQLRRKKKQPEELSSEKNLFQQTL